MLPVIIENRPAHELIAQHDGVDTLFYVDPPYLEETRSDRARKAYRHELTDEDHVALLRQLRLVAGMVVLSGYPHPLYDQALVGGWRRVETAAHADGARDRTEVLWINPVCAAALEREQAQKTLFEVKS
jgi:DNA adenine methylase